MKSLLLFLSSLSDPISLRVLALLQDRKQSANDIAGILKASPAIVAQKLKQFTDVGLIKLNAENGLVRLRSRHAGIVEDLFTHFDLSTKKDTTFRHDAKADKAHRDAKKKAEKALKKAAVKKEAAKPPVAAPAPGPDKKAAPAKKVAKKK